MIFKQPNPRMERYECDLKTLGLKLFVIKTMNDKWSFTVQKDGVAQFARLISPRKEDAIQDAEYWLQRTIKDFTKILNA